MESFPIELADSVTVGLKFLNNTINRDVTKKLIVNAVKQLLVKGPTLPARSEIYESTAGVEAKQADFAVCSLLLLAAKHSVDILNLRLMLDHHKIDNQTIEQLIEAYENLGSEITMTMHENFHKQYSPSRFPLSTAVYQKDPTTPKSIQKDEKLAPPQPFTRADRLSMQLLSDRATHGKGAYNHSTNGNASSKSLPRETKPLGQANAKCESFRKKIGKMFLITNPNGGPLGLTAIPDQENGGLVVQCVEPGGRAEIGKLRKGDRILEINGVKLTGLAEVSVQQQLRKCLASTELLLKVIRAGSEEPQGETFSHVSPPKKLPSKSTPNTLQTANTRKLGRRIEISLQKGPKGLGFSVTTRDNQSGGQFPVYIKNILPKGAAVEDGRLRPGDRLLEVDNIPITGKTQPEVVDILRATELGAMVNIVISRQQDNQEVHEREIGDENRPKQPPPPVLPPKNVKKSPSSQIIDEKLKINTSSTSDENGNISWKNDEMLKLNIPVYDTEKAGLGVSIKGKTGPMQDGDLGIFIKSVFHGGAASRDGRLRMNDQLLSVNEIPLIRQSNADAMDTLRRAMLQKGDKNPGIIVLEIARKAAQTGSESIKEVKRSFIATPIKQSGTTLTYLSPGKYDDDLKTNQSTTTADENGNRSWSNPVIDRLTGGTGSGLRNDNYFNSNWSPMKNLKGSDDILIEDDTEPPTIMHAHRPHFQHQTSVSASEDNTSLDTSVDDAFSRDAIGRKSMSEKRHAAIDAKETETYQRNKKTREDNLTNRIGSMKTSRLSSNFSPEASQLGPSLGMRKSSSLESLQTMVQEIQMSDKSLAQNASKAPRGRGRQESLRAAVKRPETCKDWYVQPDYADMNDLSNRGDPQSSSKKKEREKKSGIFKGIGHMFGFGKHRKDSQSDRITEHSSWSYDDKNAQSPKATPNHHQRETSQEMPRDYPYRFQPHQYRSFGAGQAAGSRIGQNDAFNYRYSHHANYNELQMQMGFEGRRNQHYHSQRPARSNIDLDRYQQYNGFSPIAARAHRYPPQPAQFQAQIPLPQFSRRPASSYYETDNPHRSFRQTGDSFNPLQNSSPVRINGNSPRTQLSGPQFPQRGPFVTQVHIRDDRHPWTSKI